jgi:hypothetical protein
MKLKYKLLLAAGLFLSVTSAQAVTITTGSGSADSVGDFGAGETLTYGQVFTAPVTGTLDSFTLYLNNTVGGNLFGALGAWNGTGAFDLGLGVATLLYQSANVASTPGLSPYTFAPGASVTAGQQYVAFLSVFGTNATTSTTMPLADDDSQPDIEYFVWNNTTDPNNAAWNYFANYGDARFDATFTNGTISPVPVPAALPLLVTGLAGLGGLAARRKRKDAMKR